MNKQECDILSSLRKEPYTNQRLLAECSGYSLGIVNRSVRSLIQEGYIDSQMQLTEMAKNLFEKRKPGNAIILAAGFGMRMVPINMETSKAFLEIHGELLIERLIRQLKESGIQNIYIVVGFMKEQFDYLIDKYNVTLIVNPEYALKNNLHSLKLAKDYISNTYIIPCDVWCDTNPFHRYELYSWYMVSDLVDNESEVRVNRKRELIRTREKIGNAMIGIAYLLEEEAKQVRNNIVQYCRDEEYENAFWEEALYKKDKMLVVANVVPASDTYEINTYEQLRDIDSKSEQLKTRAIKTAAQVLNVRTDELGNISILKKGMTNRSFLFTCKKKKYIMRVPGEGTDQLINRFQEAAVYRELSGKGVCDNIIYLNAENGYKITEYLDSRVCDPYNPTDVNKCMEKLREFHSLKLQVDHTFHIYDQIEFYESLWKGEPSIYRDYLITKRNVFSLKPFIELHAKEYALTHIDAVPDNFLFADFGGKEEIRLIDWEYAGMQDQDVDLAMFCIYAMYDKPHIDNLIDAYYPKGCTRKTRIKIYCYISLCGLLWSNWCEYKRTYGVEFGEYSMKQYRFAKDYYKIAMEEIKKAEGERYE